VQVDGDLAAVAGGDRGVELGFFEHGLLLSRRSRVDDHSEIYKCAHENRSSSATQLNERLKYWST